MQLPRFICWIGSPRTGTNYLTDLLTNLGDVWSLREIFQPGGVHAYNDVRGYVNPIIDTCLHAGVLASNPYDCDDPKRSEAFIEFARAQPGRLLDLVGEAAGSSMVSFKIFVGHLEHELLAEQVLGRSDLVAAIVHRDPIEAFVSRMKGIAAGRFNHIDTTEICVELDWVEYRNFVKQGIRFQCRAMRACISPVPIVAYEEFTAHSDERSRLCFIADRLDASCGTELASRVPEICWSDGVKQQDRRRAYAETVGNWHAFLDTCRANGLDGRHSRHLGVDGQLVDGLDARFHALAQWANPVEQLPGASA